MALALAERLELPSLVAAARNEIRGEFRTLARGDRSAPGAWLAAQAAPRLGPAGRFFARRGARLERGAMAAELWSRASEVASEAAPPLERASALLAAKAGVAPYELHGRAAEAWAGCHGATGGDPSLVTGALAASVLAGTAPVVPTLPPAAADRVLAAQPTPRLFADGGEAAEPTLPSVTLAAAWRRAMQAAGQGQVGPASELLRGLTDVLWVGGDGNQAAFLIAGLAVLLNPATALSLVVNGSERAMARNRTRFQLRLAGLVLAPFPPA